MDEHLRQYFSYLLNATENRRNRNLEELYIEYYELEKVPPAPGQPGKQHDAMIQKGISTNLEV